MIDYRHIPDADLVVVEIDPSLASAVGLHHTLESSIADLVDNSIDAGATQVRIRLLLDGDRPVGLQVIDNGSGMDSSDLERAMTYAGSSSHQDKALGHFGVGLKAASLSQADTALVMSKKDGATPAGWKLVRTGDRTAPRAGKLDTDLVTERLTAVGIDAERPGTLVEWREPRTFTSSGDAEEQMIWTAEAVETLVEGLGITFHRLLDRVEIVVQNIEMGSQFQSAPRRVFAINPFGYARSGDPSFPERLEVEMPDGTSPVGLVAHIWPQKAHEPEYDLRGNPGANHQGFFVYRNDRLLVDGSWCGMYSAQKSRALARVELHLLEGSAPHAVINPEKSGVELSSDLRRAIEAATSAKGDFRQFLKRAEAVAERTGRRQARPLKVVEPRRGLPRKVLDAYDDTMEYFEVEPVSVVWKILDPDRVFNVDREARELQLNTKYRRLLNGGEQSVRRNDQPVLRTLFHLLLQEHFEGSYAGSREKRQQEAWNTILLAAVNAQKEQLGG